MTQNIQDFLGMCAIGIGVAITGTVLSVFWLRSTQGEWPDKDQVLVLLKIYVGIGAFGVVAYLLMKYG
jgi:hypothetical protein